MIANDEKRQENGVDWLKSWDHGAVCPRSTFGRRAPAPEGHERLELRRLRFRGLEREVCPFANLPEKKAGRRGAGLTAAKMVDG